MREYLNKSECSLGLVIDIVPLVAHSLGNVNIPQAAHLIKSHHDCSDYVSHRFGLQALDLTTSKEASDMSFANKRIISINPPDRFANESHLHESYHSFCLEQTIYLNLNDGQT